MAFTRGCSVAWLLAALAALAGCGGSDDEDPTLRQTSYGRVQGVDDSADQRHLRLEGRAVREAAGGRAALEGAGRSRRVDATPSATQQFGNACVQYGRIYGPGANNRYDATIGTTLNQAVGSEDCLYLNIWRPATGDGGLPVIVFVHGGSNVSGYTADPVYDGAALAKAANAVVVTVNYRLGIFGFLNLPQLKAGTDASEDSGNFALLDIIKALQFVNRDIAQLRRRPGNVTLMGQSAGAINVYALLTSPLMVNASPQLFHRAVPLSGGLSLATQPAAGQPADAEPGIGLAGAGQRAAVQPADRRRAGDRHGVGAGLCRDARRTRRSPPTCAAKTPATLLPTLLTQARRRSASPARARSRTARCCRSTRSPRSTPATTCKVPVLAGNTRDEAKLFPTFLALSPALGGVSGRLVSDAHAVRHAVQLRPRRARRTITIEQWIPAVYLPVTTPVTGFNARTDLLNQIFFIASRDNMLERAEGAAERASGTTASTGTRSRRRGTTSTARRTRSTCRSCSATSGRRCSRTSRTRTANRPGRLALSSAMMESLGAFAQNGDPNDAALGVTWPAWPSQAALRRHATAKAITVQ